MDHKSPAGFAKFIISVPGAQSETGEKDLRELQDILATTLRIIWAPY